MAKAVWEGILLRSTCLSLAREDRPFQRRLAVARQPVNRGSEIWPGVNKGASIRDRRHNGCEPAPLAIFGSDHPTSLDAKVAILAPRDPRALHCLALQACSFGGAGIAGD